MAQVEETEETKESPAAAALGILAFHQQVMESGALARQERSEREQREKDTAFAPARPLAEKWLSRAIPMLEQDGFTATLTATGENKAQFQIKHPDVAGRQVTIELRVQQDKLFEHSYISFWLPGVSRDDEQGLDMSDVALTGIAREAKMLYDQRPTPPYEPTLEDRRLDLTQRVEAIGSKWLSEGGVTYRDYLIAQVAGRNPIHHAIHEANELIRMMAMDEQRRYWRPTGTVKPVTDDLPF